MKRNWTRTAVAVLATVALLISGISVPGSAQAAAKPKLNKKKVTLKVGKTVKLKLNHAKKVKWSSSNKKVASVNKKGKVKAKKVGKANIVAKYKGKKYTCKVTVKERGGNGSGSEDPSASPKSSAQPSGTASAKPSASAKPTATSSSSPATGPTPTPANGSTTTVPGPTPGGGSTGSTTTYQVALNVKKDGSSWSTWSQDGKSFALYTTDGRLAAEFDDSTQKASVPDGTYFVYENGENTEVIITVSGQDVSAAQIDYFTMKYILIDDNGNELDTLLTLYLRKDAVIPWPMARDLKGYNVGQWYLSKKSGGSNEVNNKNQTISNATQYYGVGELEPYTVYLDLNGAGNGNKDTSVWDPNDYNNLTSGDGAILKYMDGGWLIEYNVENDTITLPQPKNGAKTFIGWTGSNGTVPEKTVTIPKGTAGDRSYKANWSLGIDADVTADTLTNDILTLTNGQKVALNISQGQMVREDRLGTDIQRIGTAPQGYTTYSYNKNGDYSNYLVVYAYNERVVGMATMAKDFQYQYGTSGETVKYGDGVPSGWKSLKNGYDNPGYYYEDGNAYVMVYENKVNGQGVYALQVFSKTVTKEDGTTKDRTLDDLVKVEDLSSVYSSIGFDFNPDQVSSSQAEELMEWANAYRKTASGKKKFDVWPVGVDGSSAAMACDDLWNSIADYKGGNTASEGSLISKYEDIYGMMPAWMREVNGSRNPDAFGYLTWWLGNDDIKNDLYGFLVKTPAIDEYYACAGYWYEESNGKYQSCAVLHFVHP